MGGCRVGGVSSSRAVDAVVVMLTLSSAVVRLVDSAAEVDGVEPSAVVEAVLTQGIARYLEARLERAGLR